ncbi:hypothetical protein ACJ41O_007893 [Fusarium nematophilum]
MAGQGAPSCSSKGSEPRLLRLPYELISNIAASLPRLDFVNFRLCSSKIAECIRPQLALAHFDGVPWRLDGKRIHELSLIPSCARRIRSVKFNMARIDEELILELIEEIEEPLPLDLAECVQFISRFSPQEARLPLELVIPALIRLPNLTAVHLTWNEIPWAEPLLNEDVFGEDMSMELPCDEVFEAQQSILDALRVRDRPLKSLTIEPLMHQKLAMPSALDPCVRNVFGSVTRLNLVVDYSVGLFTPQRFDYFVSLMVNLRELRVRALMSEYEPADADFLRTTRLQHLEKVVLSHMHLQLANFGVFLLAHADTLRQVELKSMYGLCEPESPIPLDWDSIFQLMQEKLTKLESISIRGFFAHEDGGGQMFFRGGRDVLPPQFLLEELLAIDSSELEEFILEGGDYPQPGWLC